MKKSSNKGLLPTIKMVHEFCTVLTDMERAGIKIDVEALDSLEAEYTERHQVLETELRELAQGAMGDMPINLNSPEQLSMLVFSRKVKNKEQWAEIFNLGTEMRGASKKPKRPKYYKPDVFRKLVQALTEVVYKTDASQCPACKGKGRIAKVRKDGTYGDARYRCPSCDGIGIIYSVRMVAGKPVVAGFARRPESSEDLTTNGFATDKETLERLARGSGDDAKDFLTKMVEFNQISTYLSSFVGGIRRAIRGDCILHTQFMQAVAATGRLSSRDPNFQNQPRGATFPVRRVVVSRWKGGKICSGDYAQLEFRTAVELSGDKDGEADIAAGIDAHRRTADILTAAGQPTSRQGAKPNTFKPLYGGTSGTDAERTYYRAFLEEMYPRIGEWHNELCSQAISSGKLVLPSGREYAFPFAKRFPSGGVSGRTQIVNYPVQGFATGDIVPVAVIEIAKLYKKYDVKSILMLTVHDDITTDVYPGEEEIIVKLKAQAMEGVKDKILERYGYMLRIPLAIEIKMGDNWLDMEKVYG